MDRPVIITHGTADRSTQLLGRSHPLKQFRSQSVDFILESCLHNKFQSSTLLFDGNNLQRCSIAFITLLISQYVNTADPICHHANRTGLQRKRNLVTATSFCPAISIFYKLFKKLATIQRGKLNLFVSEIQRIFTVIITSSQRIRA